jgi:hypothetical protein
MDLSQIHDLQQLKAMAYDQIAAKEQAENNLRVINQRIAQIGEVTVVPVPNGQAELPLDAPAENENAATDETAEDNTTTSTTIA